MNRDTAITQYGLAATNVNSPTGNVSYEQVGKWPDGTPRYQQTVTRSPEDQKLADLMYSAYGKLGESGNAMLDKIRASLGMPFSVDAGRSKTLSDMQKQFLDPEWEQKESGLESQLANQGVAPGSDAYARAKQQFNDSKSRAYDQLYLDAYQKAEGSALLEHNQPYQDLNNLIRGPQGTAPTPATPTPGVAPVDYSSLVSDLFKTQQSGYNAQLGAIGTAAGAAGGWAAGKYSDRRLKRDVQLIGWDPRGWGIYLFRYLWSRVIETGYMADEVALVRPDAVHSSGNFLLIDYGALSDGR